MNKIVAKILNTASILMIVVGVYQSFGPLMQVYADAPEPPATIAPIFLANEVSPESPRTKALAPSEIVIAPETLTDETAASIEKENNYSQEDEMIYVGDFLATAYCCEKYEHICGEGHGITKSGKPVKAEVTVAADWSILPEGTWIFIEDVGIRQVQDIGGSIKNMRIDVAVDTHKNALKWAGYGNHKVYILPGYTPSTEKTEAL